MIPPGESALSTHYQSSQAHGVIVARSNFGNFAMFAAIRDV
jgi:hypothetical protein